MTSIVVFASYDKDGIVHDYVLGYLRYLKEVADKIIFIADNYADEYEQNKLKELVDYAEFYPHGEYDFGSYKRGYHYAKINGWLDSANELVFCNDSCFCISSLIPIFETMKKRSCDFWGMIKSHEIQDHLQSYFLVFKKNVFMHKEFVDWIKAIKHQDNIDNVIKNYEIPLTSFLESQGFISDALYTTAGKSNPTVKPLRLLKHNVPLIKRKVFTIIGNSEESVILLLFKLKQNYRNSYTDICNYYKKTFSCFFPIVFPCGFDKFKRFIYQKKFTKSGKLIIKICKIPVFSKNISATKLKYCFFGITLFSIKKNNEKNTFKILGIKKSFFIEKELNTITPNNIIKLSKVSSLLVVFDLCYGGGTGSYFFAQKNKLISNFNLLRIQFINEKYKLTLYTDDKEYTLWIKKLNLLTKIKIDEIIVNHLIGFPQLDNLLKFILSLKRQQSKISARIHDYFSVCPNYNFMMEDKFCGGPDTEKCITCLEGNKRKHLPSYKCKKTGIIEWREMWHDFYSKIDKIIVFSQSTLNLFTKAYPDLNNIIIKPHEVPYLRSVNIVKHAGINIGVLGSIVANSKGKKILAEIEHQLEMYPDIKLIVIGEFESRSQKTIITGKYERDMLPDLIEKHQIDIVLIPSVCPETFSYTTAEAMMMKLPVACFNIGAPAERIKHYEKGLIISQIDAEITIKEIIRFLNRRNDNA